MILSPLEFISFSIFFIEIIYNNNKQYIHLNNCFLESLRWYYAFIFIIIFLSIVPIVATDICPYELTTNWTRLEPDYPSSAILTKEGSALCKYISEHFVDVQLSFQAQTSMRQLPT